MCPWQGVWTLYSRTCRDVTERTTVFPESQCCQKARESCISCMLQALFSLPGAHEQVDLLFQITTLPIFKDSGLVPLRLLYSSICSSDNIVLNSLFPSSPPTSGKTLYHVSDRLKKKARCSKQSTYLPGSQSSREYRGGGGGGRSGLLLQLFQT